jgi:hypothetical protein
MNDPTNFEVELGIEFFQEAINVINFYAQDKYSNNKEYGPEEVLEDQGKKAQQFLEKWGIK